MYTSYKFDNFCGRYSTSLVAIHFLVVMYKYLRQSLPISTLIYHIIILHACSIIHVYPHIYTRYTQQSFMVIHRNISLIYTNQHKCMVIITGLLTKNMHIICRHIHTCVQNTRHLASGCEEWMTKCLL